MSRSSPRPYAVSVFTWPGNSARLRTVRGLSRSSPRPYAVSVFTWPGNSARLRTVRGLSRSSPRPRNLFSSADRGGRSRSSSRP
ncbi:hypothetical protein GCM10022284_48990 [Streptomyces hundungensis]